MDQQRLDQVMDALRTVEDPELHKDLVTLNMARDIEIDGGNVSLTVVLTTPACPLRDEIDRRVRAGLNQLDWVESIDINMTAEVSQGGGMGEAAPIPGIKNAVAVASGKGGVGKTTTTVNLGIALARQGASVGILDADVYGPNIPIMLGAEGAPMTVAGKIAPIEAHGIKLMSLGFMLEEGAPVIWRGPMIGGAIGQLLNDVDWGELDYLLIDMPPGTGDASLSLAQLVPLAGALIVSTPQAVALQDVLRSISMWEKLGVPVLGLVENMSYFLNPADGSRLEIFGHGGARKAAEEQGIEFLGEISLDQAIRVGGDNGTPVAADESNPQAAAYAEIAGRMAAAISVKNEERAEPLPML
jgi:ATP-binding protein involved in chromosome partitioning